MSPVKTNSLILLLVFFPSFYCFTSMDLNVSIKRLALSEYFKQELLETNMFEDSFDDSYGKGILY